MDKGNNNDTSDIDLGKPAVTNGMLVAPVNPNILITGGSQQYTTNQLGLSFDANGVVDFFGAIDLNQNCIPDAAEVLDNPQTNLTNIQDAFKASFIAQAMASDPTNQIYYKSLIGADPNLNFYQTKPVWTNCSRTQLPWLP